jgi:hypothetical protein
MVTPLTRLDTEFVTFVTFHILYIFMGRVMNFFVSGALCVIVLTFPLFLWYLPIKYIDIIL